MKFCDMLDIFQSFLIFFRILRFFIASFKKIKILLSKPRGWQFVKPGFTCFYFCYFLHMLQNRIGLVIRPASTEGLPTVMLVIAWISTMPMLVGKVICFQPILGVIVVSHGHSGQGPLLVVWQGELEFDHFGVKIHLASFRSLYVCNNRLFTMR